MFSTQLSYTKYDTPFTNSIVSFIKNFRVESDLNFLQIRSGRARFGNRLSRVGSGSKIAIPAHL